jgi:large subunit ribosomal protein L23
MRPDQVIIEPILTEKSNILRESGVYTFRVNPKSNKIEIKRAVSELFNVHAVDCQVLNVKGKPKRTRYAKGKTASWKKAIVKLAEGEKIAVFEGA